MIAFLACAFTVAAAVASYAGMPVGINLATLAVVALSIMLDVEAIE